MLIVRLLATAKIHCERGNGLERVSDRNDAAIVWDGAPRLTRRNRPPPSLNTIGRF